MKTVIFVVLLAMSAMFLSCSDDSASCKTAAKPSYEGLDPICESEQRKLVQVFDMHLASNYIDWDYVCSHAPGYVPGSGLASITAAGSSEGGHTFYKVNGIDMTREEFEAYESEYYKKYYEELERNTRTLEIPCLISGGVALLTDEEIAELMEKYDEIAIGDYIEPTPGGNLIPPVIDEGNESDQGCY